MNHDLSFGDRCIAFFLFLLIRLFGVTYRFRVSGESHFANAQSQHQAGACAVMLWHENIFPALVYFRGQKMAPLASHSRDGAIITRIMDRLRFRTVRGSSSRGGGKARDDLVATVDSGFCPVLTVDGPRGPRRVAKSGVIDIARRSGVTIVPFAAVARSRWVLRSWDKFQVPKPFSVIEAAFGPPLEVPPYAAGALFGQYRTNAQSALSATQMEVEHRAGVLAAD